MRVFRATYKDRQGRRREAAKWYIEFSDHLEAIRRLPAFTDKKQSEEFGRKIEKLVACRVNDEAPDLGLSRWLESLPKSVRTKLARIGLVSALRLTATAPLADHIADFHKALTAKGSSGRHADLTLQRLQTLCEHCRFRFWSDIKATRVEQQLADWRANGIPRPEKPGKPSRRSPRPISRQSSNHYLQAIRQFGRWNGPQIRKAR